MDTMAAYLTIGDFARASHMSVKMLRHYHEIGLLPPADVDPRSGYRRYTTDQLPAAQVIRRFRELGMPLEDIHGVLSAPDVPTRNRRIAAHLSRLEAELGRTQRAVASLRDLLAAPPSDVGPAVELRTVPATHAAAITEQVDAQDSVAWLQGALGELHATLAAQQQDAAAPAGGMYPDELFTEHRATVTVFVPCRGEVRSVGRVSAVEVPPAELAVITHVGPPEDVDRSYAALATWVADRALAVAGAIREYYVVGARDTPDPAQWRTEIGWPIFRTAESTDYRS